MAKQDENFWNKTKNEASEVKKMGEKGGKAAQDAWNDMQGNSSKNKGNKKNK